MLTLERLNGRQCLREQRKDPGRGGGGRLTTEVTNARHSWEETVCYEETLEQQQQKKKGKKSSREVKTEMIHSHLLYSLNSHHLKLPPNPTFSSGTLISGLLSLGRKIDHVK